MKKSEQELVNNRKLIIEIDNDQENGTESVKTYIINSLGEVETDSTTITCTCNGQSVTRTCSRDGYCDCSGNTPRVVCT